MFSPRKFIDPKTGKPDDRAWLEDQILVLIDSKTIISDPVKLSEREIYKHLAPTDGWSHHKSRPSWRKKNRRTKRAMLAAALRRLIAAGKLKITAEFNPHHKSMHGIVRSNLKSDRHLFGNEWDGRHRYYATTNILDALVEALNKE